MTNLFETIHTLWLNRSNGPIAKRISALNKAVEEENYSEALGLADDPTFHAMAAHTKKLYHKIPATDDEKIRYTKQRQNFAVLERIREADLALKDEEISYAADLLKDNPKAFEALVKEETILSYRVRMEAAKNNADNQHGYDEAVAKANYVYRMPDDQVRWEVLYQTVHDPHIPLNDTASVFMEYVHPMGRDMRDSQVRALKLLVSEKGFDVFAEDAVDKYGSKAIERLFSAVNDMILRNEKSAVDVLIGSKPQLDKFIEASARHYDADMDYITVIPEDLLGNGPSAARLKIAELLLEEDEVRYLKDASVLVQNVLQDDSGMNDKHHKVTQHNAVSMIKKIIFIENKEGHADGFGMKAIHDLSHSDHNSDRNLGKKIAEEINMPVNIPGPQLKPL